MASYEETCARMVNSANGLAVTAQQDADFYAGIVGGAKPVVLPVGKMMEYKIVDSNTIAVYDGVLVSQGRRIQIDAKQEERFTISSGTSTSDRYNILGFKYAKDPETGEETLEKFVEEIDDNPDASITEDEIRDGAPSSMISLYRVKATVNGIETVEPLFEEINSMRAMSAAFVVDTEGQSKTINNWTVRWRLVAPKLMLVQILRTLPEGLSQRRLTEVISNALPFETAEVTYLPGIMHVGGLPVGYGWAELKGKTANLANTTYNGQVTIQYFGIVPVK